MTIELVKIIGHLDLDPDPRCPRMKECTTEMWEALTEEEKNELIAEDIAYFRRWVSTTQPVNPKIQKFN